MPDLAKVPGYGWDAPFSGDAPAAVANSAKLAKMISKRITIKPTRVRRMPKVKKDRKFY